MNRLFAFLGGVLSGGAVGTALGLLFTPASGDAMRGGIRQRYADAQEAGRAAAELRRLELEAQLAHLTHPDADVAETHPQVASNPPGATTT